MDNQNEIQALRQKLQETNEECNNLIHARTQTNLKYYKALDCIEAVSIFIQTANTENYTTEQYKNEILKKLQQYE